MPIPILSAFLEERERTGGPEAADSLETQLIEAARRALRREFGDAGALSPEEPGTPVVVSRIAVSLGAVLEAELNVVLLRAFPPPSTTPGSLGELLASGGGWTRGASGPLLCRPSSSAPSSRETSGSRSQPSLGVNR